MRVSPSVGVRRLLRAGQLWATGRLWAALGLCLLASCEKPAPPVAQLPPPPVVVQRPEVREVTDYYETTGRTEEVRNVDIKARVTGYLTKINFQPSSEVKAGDLLFEIDPRPYEATVAQAKAQIDLAQARLTRAQADLARAEKLRPTGAISQEEFDKIVADRAEAQAAVEQGEAQLQNANLDLGFTRITAPWNGVISRNFVSEGNLIQLGTSGGVPLTNIVQIDPIYMYFDVDEQAVLKFRAIAQKHENQTTERYFPPVAIGLMNQEGYPIHGKIDFVDNKLDPSTGTIQVRGVFDNSKVGTTIRLLTPGLFCRVRVPMGEPHQAILIPDRAVGVDQDKRFVWTVDVDNKVVRRVVTLGELHDGERAVLSGLKPDERVIVEGVQRVRPGMIVTPQMAPETSQTPAAVDDAAAQATPAPSGTEKPKQP